MRLLEQQVAAAPGKQQAMELLAECWRTGIWPGYGDLVQEPIDLPAWNRD